MIKGIHHVAFKCETQEQYDEMIYFYHELLELPIMPFHKTIQLIHVMDLL